MTPENSPLQYLPKRVLRYGLLVLKLVSAIKADDVLDDHGLRMLFNNDVVVLRSPTDLT